MFLRISFFLVTVDLLPAAEDSVDLRPASSDDCVDIRTPAADALTLTND